MLWIDVLCCDEQFLFGSNPFLIFGGGARFLIQQDIFCLSYMTYDLIEHLVL
jgi:hypothetical protein